MNKQKIDKNMELLESSDITDQEIAEYNISKIEDIHEFAKKLLELPKNTKLAYWE